MNACFSICSARMASLPAWRLGQRRAIDEVRLHVGAHHFHRAGHQRLERIGDVVRLVEHVGRREARDALELGVDQLVEDQEQLERLDRSAVEIVVAELAVVEVEAAERAAAESAARRSARC